MSSNVVKVAFRPDEAAEYLGISKFTLRNIRKADRRAAALGEPTRGPKFICVSRTICLYRRDDLDTWLSAQAAATEKGMQPHRNGRGR
jgi:hypothetical protein